MCIRREKTAGKWQFSLVMVLFMFLSMLQFTEPEAQAKTLSAPPAENVFLYVKSSDGTTYTPIVGNNFTMPGSSVMVTAQFENVPSRDYAVLVDSAITGGTVTVSSASGEQGDSIAVTTTPAAGKLLKEGSLCCTVDGTTWTAIAGNSFTMPAGDVIVTAQFENEAIPELAYSLSASSNSVNLGESVTLTAALSSNLSSCNLYGAQYEIVLDAATFTNIIVAPATGWHYDAGTADGSTTISFALLNTEGLAAGYSTPIGTVTATAARAGTHSIASGRAVATDAQGLTIPAIEMPAPVSIAVNSSDTYSVTVDSNLTGGSISVSPSLGAPNVPVTVTATPDAGKQLVEESLKYTADGGTTYTEITATEGVYGFILPAAHVFVTAAFEDLPPVTTCTLTLTGEGLTANLAGGNIAENTAVTITVAPAQGKQIAAFTVNGADKKAELVDGKYTFNITADTAVAVTYEDMPAAKPLYTLTPVEDAVYTIGTNPDGSSTMTVNTGQTGLKYFAVAAKPVVSHKGDETVIFTHRRDGTELQLNATVADFDIANTAQAGFNAGAGDVIKVYIVDCLTSDSMINPVVFQ